MIDLLGDDEDLFDSTTNQLDEHLGRHDEDLFADESIVQRPNVTYDIIGGTTIKPSNQNEGDTVSLKQKLMHMFSSLGQKSLVDVQALEEGRVTTATTLSTAKELVLEENMDDYMFETSTIQFKIMNDDDEEREEEEDYEEVQYPPLQQQRHDDQRDELQLEVDVSPQRKVRKTRKNSQESFISLQNNNQSEDYLTLNLQSQPSAENDISRVMQLLSQFDNVRVVRTGGSAIPSTIDIAKQVRKQSSARESSFPSLFKASKERSPKEKQSKKRYLFLDFFSSRAQRILAVHQFNLVVMEKHDSMNLRVCSVTPLSDLFKIFNDKQSPEVRMYFLNEKKTIGNAPICKIFEVNDKQHFLAEIRKALQSINMDFNFETAIAAKK